MMESEPLIEYWISTTIKKKWMVLILGGDKDCELKGNTEWWCGRLEKAKGLLGSGKKVGINFLCGRDSYKYEVGKITFHARPLKIDEQVYQTYYKIWLGDRIG